MITTLGVKRRQGFTLVELLVVIAIIGILIAILVPAVQAVRATARSMHCRSNLRQLAVATLNYENSHTKLPPGVVHLDSDFRTGRHSGLVYLLPHLEMNNLYQNYNFNLAWNEGSNLDVIATRVSTFECPASASFVEQNGGIEGGPLDYAMNKGDVAYLCVSGTGRGPFDINSKTRMSEFRDGTSQTILFGEAASDPSIDGTAT